MPKYLLSIVFCINLLGGNTQDLPVELRMQGGHDHQVTVVTTTHNGQMLASGGYDRTIILWDVASGREIRRITRDSYLKSLDFSPDDKLLASVSEEGIVAIHEVETGKLIRQLGDEKIYCRTVKFLPDGKRFITAGGPITATLWSLDKEEPIGMFEGERYNCINNCQQSMDISPDGKWLILGNNKGETNLWSIPKQTVVNTYKQYPDNHHSTSGVLGMAFLPDSKFFVVGSEDEGILKWSVTDHVKPTIILEPQIVRSGLKFTLNDLAIDRKGEQLAALFLEGVQGSFQRDQNLSYHLFDLKSNQEKASLDLGELNNLKSIIFSQVSDTIYLANGATPKLLDPAKGTIAKTFSGHLTDYQAPYWIMKATKKHLYLPPEIIIERVGNQVISWSMKTGKPVEIYPKHQDLVLGMALNHDQTLLATCGADRRIQVSKVATSDSLWNKEMDSPVFTVAFTPDGNHLVTAHLAGRVILWEAQTGKYIRDIGRVNDWYQTPMDLEFTSTGLMTWGDFLMDTITSERVVEFDTHEDRVHAVTTSKDGKSMLTTGWDGRVILRELYYGGKVTEIFKSDDHIYCAEFSPDEKMIAVGGADNRITFLNTKGERQFELTGHSSSVVSLSFTENGKHLVSGSEDGSVKVWDLSSQKEIYTHVMLDEQRWTTQVPSGHFYTTQEGMETMFFVKGIQTYELEQFFEKFYQPELTIDLLATSYQNRDELSGQISTLPPPEVKIAYPSGGATDQNEVEILVRVTDLGGGIDEVKLMHNGKMVVSDLSAKLTGSGKSQAMKYHLDLVPGVNYIRASGFSKGRIESKADEIKLVRPADEPTAACYILSIGINQYKNPRLNLNYAVDDAQSMATLIEEKSRNLFTKVETHLITNEDATRDKIIEKLVSLADVIRPTDVFYFFYAGHGSLLNDNFYFIPTNSTRLYEEAGLQAEALYVGDFVNYLKNIKALKQVLFIDACHSGGSTAVLASRGAGEEKALAQLSRSAGVHILAAAGSDQTATEFADLGHGLFTYAVLQALSGKADGAPADNKVTVYELKSFLDDQVPEYSMKYKHTPQYPTTFSIGHDFPIVIKE